MNCTESTSAKKKKITVTDPLTRGNSHVLMPSNRVRRSHGRSTPMSLDGVTRRKQIGTEELEATGAKKQKVMKG